MHNVQKQQLTKNHPQRNFSDEGDAINQNNN